MFAPNAKLRPRVVRQAEAAPTPVPGAEVTSAPVAGPEREKRRPRVDWAFLQRHTFEADVWRCPCGGRRRLLAVVTRRATAEEVLHNLGLGSARSPLATGQSPPPARLALWPIAREAKRYRARHGQAPARPHRIRSPSTALVNARRSRDDRTSAAPGACSPPLSERLFLLTPRCASTRGNPMRLSKRLRFGLTASRGGKGRSAGGALTRATDRPTRREVIHAASVAAAALVLPACPTPACIETEEDVLGPFYRPDSPFRTVLASRSDGEWLKISGTVIGTGNQCGPLEGAVVDVWHANAQASYDMSSAEYPWRGKIVTDAHGAYQFETILPGRYLNGSQYRPRHIHFRVSSPGHESLVTQLYFDRDPFLASDPFADPSLVIPLSQGEDGYSGQFEIALRAT